VTTTELTAVQASQEKINRLHDALLAAARRLNDFPDPNANGDIEKWRREYRSLLQETCDAASNYFNAIEDIIATTELLGPQRSEFWAKDLARTAANALNLIPPLYARLRVDYPQFLNEDAPQPAPDAFYAMESAVSLYHPKRARELKLKLEKQNFPIGGFTDPPPMNPRYSPTEKYLLYGIAIFFVLAILAVGIFVKDFNDVNIFIFRVVLALSAGAFGAVFIPGLFEVTAKWGKFGLRAGGAACFFAVVFFTNPPALVKNSVPPRAPAQQNAEKP
jgi:hypothetical protein